MLSPADISALWLTFKVASVTTLILLLLGTPLAWWLSITRSRWKALCSALIAMPLVLPPTVLGFYLLILMGPQGALGQFTEALGLGTLPFTFSGLVLASCIYSMPFVVQPLQNAFENIGPRPLEVAATLEPALWTPFSAWPSRWLSPAFLPRVFWALRIRSVSLAWC